MPHLPSYHNCCSEISFSPFASLRRRGFNLLPNVLLSLFLVSVVTDFEVDASEKKAKAAEPSRSALDSVRGDKRLNGKVVYVDFWASWCVPCKLSFPWMSELSRKNDTARFAVVTVNLDEHRASGEKFARQYGAGLEVIYDSTGALAESYHIEVMPTAMLFDPSGKLVATHRGFRESDKAKLDSIVGSLVAEFSGDHK